MLSKANVSYFFSIVSILIAIPGSAFAAFQVQDCAQAGVGLTELLLPAEKNTKTLPGNQVTLFNVSQFEPVATGAGIAITLPDLETPESSGLCKTILGMRSVDVQKARVLKQTPSVILLSIPYMVYDHRTDKSVPARSPLKVKIDLENGIVTAN